mmetsp:Transcript_23234/g.64421  ORF Transcript_23234/g.64421 Transcript_23234/m.64421 type:complete len:236 (+) Transcript_23234:1283-1990(+)
MCLGLGEIKGSRGLLLIHSKSKCVSIHLWCESAHVFLVFNSKVGLEDLDALLVNIVVRVLLQIFDLVETFGFGNENGHCVGLSGHLRLFLTDLEDVFQTFQSNGYNLGVVDGEQVTERTDAALLNEELDLLAVASRGGVRNGPCCFLSDIEFGIREQLNQWRDNVVLHDRLDLFLVSSGDVGNCPAGFLSDSLLGARQESQQTRQSVVVDDELGLQIVTSNNVSDSSQGRSLNSW